MNKIVAFLLSSTILPHAAFASEQKPEREAGDPASARSEIIVTGLKSDEGQDRTVANGALGDKSILDTPYSISVVGNEDISKRQATTIGQIFVNDPSVYSFATAGTTNWWGTQIRGLGVRNYYIDDVPLVLYWGGDFPLESIERVEALKGLTGFMYGFGSPGGAISYRTKRPTTEPLLTTEIGYRTGSDFYARLDAGGPLTKDGRLGYRLNLAGEKGTVYNGAGVNRLVAALAIEFAVTPDLDWYATATYEDSNLKHEPFQIYWDSYTDSSLPKPTYDYDRLNIGNSYYKATTLATATGLNWRFANDWSARATYGYTSKDHRSNKMFVNVLNRAGDYEGFAYNFAELDRNHFVQAMIQGKFATGPIDHDIVAGALFQTFNSQFGTNDYHWGNDFNGNIYQDQPFRVTRDVAFGTDGSPGREQQRALFLSDTLHLGEKVQAVVGARYTRYKMVDLDGDPTIDSRYRTSAVSPTLALIYKPMPYVSLYGSYAEAMEAGSRVGGEYVNVGDILKATISKQYEVGAKYEHSGMSLTAAAFRIERANTVGRLINGERYLRQDGLTLFKGVEAIASYRVDKNLKLGVGATRLDPTIRNVSEGNEDLLGNVPGQAAKWQVVGNANYYVSRVPGLSLHGNVRYLGKAPTDDLNTLYIPARTLTNIGFQYETLLRGQKIVFTGNVNNVFNVKYWGQSNIGEAVNGSLSARIAW